MSGYASAEFGRILFGGDYNPEQWDRATLEEDTRLMGRLRVNAATVGVFAWPYIQESEDRWNFDLLDDSVERLRRAGVGIVMATPTGAIPPWMAKKYPSILPVNSEGVRRLHGGRHHFCPNNAEYRRLSGEIASRLAARYRNAGLLLWHVNNEYSNGQRCHCDTCRDAFIEWLKLRHGSLEALNAAWYTSFWGHRLADWEEIEIPSRRTEMLPGAPGTREGTNFQGMALDWTRFVSDSYLACFLNERDRIREHDRRTPVTTNVCGNLNGLDHFRWGPHMDVVSWNSYPERGENHHDVAFSHDLIRGIGNQRTFLLMEQTPNQQNWQPYNAVKEPGVMALQSYQALAHGSDSVLFFQWRQSRGGCEKYHAAMVSQTGGIDNRIGRELAVLGSGLERLGTRSLGALSRADIAVVADYDSYHALSLSSGPSVALDYWKQVRAWYRAFRGLHLPVDVIGKDHDLSGYRIVVAPCLYSISAPCAAQYRSYTEEGGCLVATFMSGRVDERDILWDGDYPGAFREILGIAVEETDAPEPGRINGIAFRGNEYPAGIVCEILRNDGARIEGTYTREFYAGTPAITRKDFGRGEGWYVASAALQDSLLRDLAMELVLPRGIEPILSGSVSVDSTVRVNPEGETLYLLNFSASAEEVTIHPRFGERFSNLLDGVTHSRKIHIPPRGALILSPELIP